MKVTKKDEAIAKRGLEKQLINNSIKITLS